MFVPPTILTGQLSPFVPRQERHPLNVFLLFLMTCPVNVAVVEKLAVHRQMQQPQQKRGTWAYLTLTLGLPLMSGLQHPVPNLVQQEATKLRANGIFVKVRRRTQRLNLVNRARWNTAFPKLLRQRPKTQTWIPGLARAPNKQLAKTPLPAAEVTLVRKTEQLLHIQGRPPSARQSRMSRFNLRINAHNRPNELR